MDEADAGGRDLGYLEENITGSEVKRALAREQWGILGKRPGGMPGGLCTCAAGSPSSCVILLWARCPSRSAAFSASCVIPIRAASPALLSGSLSSLQDVARASSSMAADWTSAARGLPGVKIPARWIGL